MTMFSDINEKGAIIEITTPENVLHETLTIMSDSLIDYTAGVRSYEF